MAGLQFASDGFAFSGDMMKPFDDSEKPLRTLPATIPGDLVGTITVEVEAPAGFTANVSALVQPACFGDNNGC